MPVSDSYIHLGDKYGLIPAQRTATPVSASWTLSYTMAKYPQAYKRLQAQGYLDTEFMQQTLGTLAALDACWQGHSGTDYTFCLSRMPVIWPSGEWVLSYPYELSAADNIGQGTAAYYGTNKGSTQLTFDRAYWRAKPTANGSEQRFVRNCNWGRTDNFGYHEDFFLDKIRLTGDNSGAYDATKNIIAFSTWKSGEMSKLGRIKIENFNGSGVEVQNGTPFVADYLSVFNCGLYALDLAGCALSTINVGTLSCDDCVAVVKARKGMNDEAGGTINIGLIKNETAITDQSRGLWKGMIPLDLEGQFACTVGAIWMKGGNIHVDSLIVVKPYLSKGDFQQSQLTIGSLKADGYSTLVHEVPYDTTKMGQRWYAVNPDGSAAGMGFRATSVEYNSSLGVTKSTGMTLAKSQVKSPKRMGIQSWNGTAFVPSYDHANGTPAYTLDGGTVTPPTCTWVLGTPVVGQCVNGTQTTTTPYVPSIAGCTPSASKPPDLVTMAPCGVVTPKFSAGPLTTTTATKVPYTASKGPSITMKFTGAKFTLVAGGNSYINDRIYVYGNRFYFLPQAGGIVDLNTPVVATSSNYTLTLPEPYLPAFGIGGTHPTVVFTATSVEMN